MASDWPAYLKAAMEAAGYTSAAELARATGIGEAQVSRWLRGATQPDVINLRRLTRSLRRPLLELLVAAGHLEPEEARMKSAPEPPAREDPPSPEEALWSLPVLSEDEKEELVAYYLARQAAREHRQQRRRAQGE